MAFGFVIVENCARKQSVELHLRLAFKQIDNLTNIVNDRHLGYICIWNETKRDGMEILLARHPMFGLFE